MSSTRGRKNKSKSSGISGLYSQLAKKIVSKSLDVKAGESVTIETWNNGLDFSKQVVKEVRRIGAIPLLILEDDDAYLWGLQNSPNEALGQMGKHEFNLLSATNAYIFIPGPLIGTYVPSLTKEQASEGTAYNSSWYQAAEKAGVRGVRLTFGYVGPDLAKILGKKLDEVVVRQLKASLVDSEVIAKAGKPIMDRLVNGAEALLQTGGESLVLYLKGDLGIEDGITDVADVVAKNNISYIVPGFVWKGIDPESASGKVTITSSITCAGLVDGATLEFERGKLISWKGKDKLNQQKLDLVLGGLPEDRRRLDTLIIGLNPQLPYGFGQDRFVAGAISLAGFGITGVVSKGTLTVNGQAVVEKGKLAAPQTS
jgi:leucyl aminopeptidase (aminopeptidase T)